MTCNQLSTIFFIIFFKSKCGLRGSETWFWSGKREGDKKKRRGREEKREENLSIRGACSIAEVALLALCLLFAGTKRFRKGYNKKKK